MDVIYFIPPRPIVALKPGAGSRELACWLVSYLFLLILCLFEFASVYLQLSALGQATSVDVCSGPGQVSGKVEKN